MRNIPTITKNLLIINILAFLLMKVLSNGGGLAVGGSDLNDIFGLHFFLSPDFHLYQLVTYMFMHANFEHIFFNMFALWMFGCVVERVWGPRKFLLYYLICGVGAGLFQEMAQFGQFYMIASEQIPNFQWSQIGEVARNSAAELSLWTTVGASGAIYAILLAFGMTFPEERIFIFPLPIPIKAKWFILFYAALELFLAVNSTGDGVAHVAHLGGMVFGFFLIRHWRKLAMKGYGSSDGEELFSNLRSRWSRNRWQEGRQREEKRHSTGNPDWDYNEREQRNQQEIDAILDKIRKSGYDSLTTDEKRKLFEQSNRS